MPRWVDYIPGMHKRILAQRFGPNDSQIVSAIANPSEAINRGAEWFRHNVSQASGGDPYDNPNPLIGPGRAEQAEAGMNIAGLAELGSFPLAPKSAGGTLGTFIGPKAATWDTEKAAIAQQLLDTGADPRVVWKHLGIGKMPGGHLFSEIDDSAANFINKPTADALRYEPKLHTILNHDELLNNYPASKYLEIGDSGNYGAGRFNVDEGKISIPSSNPITGNNIPEFARKNLEKGIDDSSKSVLLHELQHSIQNKEGWPTGGSPYNTPLYDPDKVFEIRQHRKALRKSLGIDPEKVRGMIESGQPVPLGLRERLNKFDELLRQEKEIIDNKLAPIEAYRRLQGEAQARLTQDRIPLTMEQRLEQYPLEGNMIADIPFNKLITRYGGSGDQRSIINQMAKVGKK